MTTDTAPRIRLSRLIGPIALALTYGAAMLLFFRRVVASGFDLGFSDRADGIIEISVLEHWRNVLAGAATWNVTGYFHPYRDTLGYNDGYFLYGLSYGFWRLFADPFLADTLNIATFKTIGFFAAYALVARSLRWGRGAGLLVALLFTSANGLMVQAGHAQVQSIALLPVAMMLAVAIAQAEAGGRRGIACLAAVGLALLMAAWLLTSYYMAWFTLFFAAMFVACWLVTTGHWRPMALWRLVVRHNLVLESGLLAFCLAVVPFLAVYLPKVRETGGQSYHGVIDYLAAPLDPINVGPGNAVWGWLFRSFPRLFLDGEHITGIAFVLFVLAAAALWRLVVRPRAIADAPGAAMLRAFAVAIIVCWLLTLRLGDFSLWWLPYHLVPGAKGLRVVVRFQLFLILPLLLVVVAVHRRRATDWARRRPVVLAAILALLVAEQLGSNVPVSVSRSGDGVALGAVPAPPRGCPAFYVIATRRAEPPYGDPVHNGLYPHNVDAMLLAERWRVPTINGFSSFNPPDWNFADPLAADYDARVAGYAARHGLYGLCRLDMRQAQPWTRVR